MSKGSAGKVYFVLYLAVILELLIIIVERDEAEEHLHKKQKESERIVRNILSQLQLGSGAEGMNTRPQDEITISDDPQNKTKTDRTYLVDVGVNDVGTKPEEIPGYDEFSTKIQSNVEQLDYFIFYAKVRDKNNPDDVRNKWPNDDIVKKQEKDFREGYEVKDSSGVGTGWVMKSARRLALNTDETKDWRKPVYGKPGQPFDNANPMYAVGAISAFAPNEVKGNPGEIFKYEPASTERNAARNGGKYTKRTFQARFQPEGSEDETGGWYKLRFASKTNNILGVSGVKTEVDAETMVNVGSLKLKVGDLEKQRQSLVTDLDNVAGLPVADPASDPGGVQFAEKMKEIKAQFEPQAATDERAKKTLESIRLYEYITKLITPNFSGTFDQNRGAITIDVRVTKPKVGQQKGITMERDTVYAYSGGTIGLRGKSGYAQVSGVLRSTSGKEFSADIQASDALASAGGAVAAKEFRWKALVKGVPAGDYEFIARQQDGQEGSSIVKVFAPDASTDKKIDEVYVGAKVLKNRLRTPDAGRMTDDEFHLTVSVPGGKAIDTVGRDLNITCIPAAAVSGGTSIKLYWRSNITNEEVLLKEWKPNVKYQTPYVNPISARQRDASVNSNDNSVQVVIANIPVPDVPTDADCNTGAAKNETVVFKVLSAKIDAGPFKNAQLVGQPKATKTPGVTFYEVTVKSRAGSLPKTSEVKGPVTLTYTTEIAGKFKTESQTLSIPVTIKIPKQQSEEEKE